VELATVAPLQQSAPAQARRLARTTATGGAALEVSVVWRSEHAVHTDCVVADPLGLSQAALPPEIANGLVGQPIGHTARHRFAPGALLPGYEEADAFALDPDRFNGRLGTGTRIEPRFGRFYPRRLIAGVRDIAPGDRTPFRVTGLEPDLGVDLNHPLAGRDIDLGVRILDAWSADDPQAAQRQDVTGMATQGGPGMQARWRGLPTDFFADHPFARAAAEPDQAFYDKARLVDHLDRTALAQVEALYGRLVPPGSRVLDLMTSWKSHLPEDLDIVTVSGLGMNREELDANPRLGERLVHDLNLDPRLPFADGAFDAVICTVSVEYLTRPLEVFAEVNRVLKPGGRFALTFSNRWFPPKVIRAWEAAHEFERVGLVLEYFLRTGGYRDLETFSLRGLPRPPDDKYARLLDRSDPVYAVWGSRQA
jgi:SAM-dependent methyltransferase